MQQSPYWFPAKRYGWGWGLPSCWQGWIVLAVYFMALAACAYTFLPIQSIGAFLFCTFILTLALVAVCVAKGEPPGWRWGK
jgi:hypothetical protein